MTDTKRGWWSLKIHDSDYIPNDIDLEHIAKMIIQEYREGELIQEDEQQREKK